MIARREQQVKYRPTAGFSSTLDGGHVSVQATLLAHTMLHHPRAWPKHQSALGLLISLRKFFQTEWVRLPLNAKELGLYC